MHQVLVFFLFKSYVVQLFFPAICICINLGPIICLIWIIYLYLVVSNYCIYEWTRCHWHLLCIFESFSGCHFVKIGARICTVDTVKWAVGPPLIHLRWCNSSSNEQVQCYQLIWKMLNCSRKISCFIDFTFIKEKI